MTAKEFSEWISQIDGIELATYDEEKVLFLCTNENVVLRITEIAEKSNHILSIRTYENKLCFCLHNRNLSDFVEMWYGETNKGIPDLSWVTIKQMAHELKKRDNLTFAVIWMEDTGLENISLEASGSPTVLCGMLTRGLNLAIKYAEKGLEYNQSKDDT